MHDDSAERADTPKPTADQAETGRAEHEPNPPEDWLVTRARVFVEMLEKQAERARERRRTSADRQGGVADIPADVPRLRGWR